MILLGSIGRLIGILSLANTMNKSRASGSNANKAPRAQHLFRKIRDPVVADASSGSSPAAYAVAVNSSGDYNGNLSFCPFGYRGLSTANAVAGQPTTFSEYVSENAHLPWLYNQARNFERYRILNATLVVVGNVGSTATGRMVLQSSTDLADILGSNTVGLSSGGKVIDLAILASKDQRFPLDVDSSWKKCSSRLYVFNSTATGAIPVSTVNDLMFSGLNCTVVGGTSNGTSAAFTAANFFLEYDVEFRDPIAYGANL